VGRSEFDGAGVVDVDEEEEDEAECIERDD